MGGAAGRSATGGTGATGGAGGASGAGGTGGGQSCAYTVSGEQLIASPCNLTADATTGGNVQFGAANGGAFAFNATFSTLTTLTAGSYTQADASSYSGDFPLSISDFYVCSADCLDATGKPSSPQGTFALTITDPGPTQVVSGVTFWSPHGTLIVVMPARPNGAQSGSVTAHVTF